MTDKKYTVDWFSNNLSNWKDQLNKFKGKEDLNFLEIGSYEGRSAVWLLENILTNSSSRLTIIDPFGGDPSIYERFCHNTKDYANCNTIVGYSNVELKKEIINSQKFDFIYIDGAHDTLNVIRDAVMCFDLLKLGGILAFDDYAGNQGNFSNNNFNKDHPQHAIDCFLKCYEGKYVILFKGYQIFIKKMLEC